MFANEAGRIRAQRNYPQVRGAGEIERCRRKLPGDPFAFERRGYLRMDQDEPVRVLGLRAAGQTPDARVRRPAR